PRQPRRPAARFARHKRRDSADRGHERRCRTNVRLSELEIVPQTMRWATRSSLVASAQRCPAFGTWATSKPPGRSRTRTVRSLLRDDFGGIAATPVASGLSEVERRGAGIENL